MFFFDRIVSLHPLLFRIDDKLKRYKPIHLCWLFEKLGLPVPRYFVGAPGYGSDLTGGKSYSQSCYEAGHPGSDAFDNDMGTDWGCYGCPHPTTDHWVGVDFGSGEVITKLRLKPSYGLGKCRVKDFRVEGSNTSFTSGMVTLYTGVHADTDAWEEYTFSNTTAYRYYRIYVIICYGAVCIGICEAEMMESEPVAPSGCASSYVATNNAKCTWSDNSQNETNFRIEKDIDGAGFSFWKNVAANVEDSGTYTLGANHQIRFRVAAYNTVGYSAWSTSGYTYTTPTAPSGATTHYVATNLAKLTWADNSAYEEGFRLEYAYGEAGWLFWKNVSPNVIDSGNGNPGANTRAKFRVRAYRGGLYSTWSEGSYIYTIPTAPSGINLSWLVQDETVRVVWTDNSAYEQDFDIEKKSDEGAFGHLVYDAASPYDDAAPSGTDHRYAYQVRARCPDGRLSSWNTSGWIYSTPSAPTNCAITLGTINVTWSDNSAYEDGFKIELELDGGGWNLVHTTGANEQSWADTSQPTEANEKYQYRVRAYKGSLYSGYSTSNFVFAKTFIESLNLQDTYSRIWSIYRIFTENLNLSDSFSRILSLHRTFIETLYLTDTIIVFRMFHKIFTETLTLSDTVQKKISKVFTENINLSDIFSRCWSIHRIYTETVNLTDTVAKKISKTFKEKLTLIDSFSRTWSIYRIFTEVINLTDTLKKRVSKTFIETLTLSDTVSKKIAKTFTETLHLTDAFSRIVSYYRTFTEKITLTDKVKAAKVNLVNLIKKLIRLFEVGK